LPPPRVARMFLDKKENSKMFYRNILEVPTLYITTANKFLLAL